MSHAPVSMPVQGVGEGRDESSSVLREGQDKVIIDVTMTQSGYLVVTDAYCPGWRATVDGQLVEILEANHAFRAIELDRGGHTIIFIDDRLSFGLGGWSRLAGLVVLVAIPITSGCCRRMHEK